jgi:putative PIN family toxin of toxin-antitoxin system
MTVWRKNEFEVLTSPLILEDLQRVMVYPHVRKRHHWSNEHIAVFMNLIRTEAVLTPGRLEVDVVKDDPTDNKIIACAVEGKADFIVSSDIHLAKVGSYQGIPIVPPRHLLAELDEIID